jgi:hypothetical protein
MQHRQHDPGAIDPYLTVIEVDKIGVSLKRTTYKVRWHCHDGDAILTHTQITNRKAEARRHGGIGPCYMCSRRLKLGGRMGRSPERDRSDKAEVQLRSWLRVPVAAAWPKPAGNEQALVWGSQY